jgi:tetratricopeptide (TPR) repeat protein
VEAARGQIPAAIALMRTVLAENAGFAWGWNQLAVWLLEQQSTGEAEVALQQLLRLRPRDAFAHRQLGFLRLQAGDNEGAQKAFSKAIEIAPTDSAAAQNLVILQLNARQLTDASATLRLMETHQPGACTLALRILFRLESAHHDAADKLFAELGEFVDPDPWPVEAVADGYKRVHRSRRAIKILKHALKQSSCNPQAAAALIRLLLAQKRDGAAVWCFLGIKPGELQRRAASSLVRGLAELRSRFALRVLLWLRRDALFNDDSAWAQAGSALTTFNRMRDAAEWLSDWQRRRDVEPWVLFNLCLALRHLGRYEEANSLAHHVISTLGHKEHSSDMRLFLAIEAALSGEIAAAREHLAHVVVRENVAYDVQLTALIRALAEFQEVPDGDRPKAFSQLRKRFGDNFSAASVLGAGSDVRHVMRRSAQCFIEGGAGWRARTWFAWKLNWQYLLLPLLPVAFMAALSPPVMLGVLIYILRRNRN